MAAEPGYKEPVNLYVSPILESGNRKTAVVTNATAPLVAFENRERERLAPEIARLQSELKTRQSAIEKLRKSIKIGDEDAIRKIANLERNLPIVPHAPTLFTSDSTAERLEVLLADNGGRIAVLSDEGGPFDVMAGRYSATPNLDVYLKGHCQATHRVHRMGRTTVLDRPTVTVLLSPQPSLLCGLRDKGFMRDRGLLARFLFALPQSPIGSRSLEPRTMPSQVVSEYENLVTRILEWRPEQTLTLNLSHGAYQEWKEFQRTVEAQMADGGRLCRLRDWGSKLPGAALRIAGLLHVASKGFLPFLRVEIQQSEIETALEICSTLISHAIAVFGMVREDLITLKAKRILRWLVARNGDVTTKKNCFDAHHPHVFERVEDMDSCLKMLIDHCLIKIVKAAHNGRRGRPTSDLIEVNPAIITGVA